jgi:hypothetical protein
VSRVLSAGEVPVVTKYCLLPRKEEDEEGLDYVQSMVSSAVLTITWDGLWPRVEMTTNLLGFGNRDSWQSDSLTSWHERVTLLCHMSSGRERKRAAKTRTGPR